MNHFDEDRFYTTSDKALEVIGIKSKLDRWRSEGRGPEFVKYGRTILYHGAALNRWLEACTVKPAA